MDTDIIKVVPSEIELEGDRDDKLIKQIGLMLEDWRNSILKLSQVFGQLSTNGIRKAKKEFTGVLAATLIDKIVAVSKFGYPLHLVFKPGLQVSTWRLLETSTKEIVANEESTVEVKHPTRSSPSIKQVKNLTGIEVQQVFKPKYPKWVPLDKQIPVATLAKDKKAMNLDDIEEFESIVASGTNYIVITGERGSKIKCRIKDLRPYLRSK